MLEWVGPTLKTRLQAAPERSTPALALREELLAHWPALWTFVYVEGLEPTNNRAERALRPAVLWRKGSFGAQSEGGNQFVARILSVVATCRQRKQQILPLLTEAVSQFWQHKPALLLS
jgi:transposase